MNRVRLDLYQNPEGLDKGASTFKRIAWHFVNALVLMNPLNPSSGLKVKVLRMFGAKIGQRAVIKTSVNIKSPWYLEMGDDVWLGERAWIDSLAPVKLGNNVCLSQDVYLCCGNHDWGSPTFSKSVHPIIVEDGVWIATRATVMGGVTLASHSVIGASSLISKSTEPYKVYSGVPAVAVRDRKIRDQE